MINKNDISLSYWEQQSFLQYNHIIIGAGIVGLNVAIELAERFPGARILVLERGLLTTGATSRNAGFACMGSVTELLDDIQATSEIEAIQLFESRKLGLEKLRHRLGDAAIGYAANGSFELIGSESLHALDKVDYLNSLLRPITRTDAFLIANEKIAGFGFSATYTRALIRNMAEGEINSGKMLMALTNLALQKGIEIKTGAEVLGHEEHPNHVAVCVKDPFRQVSWQFRSDTLTICTNAFTNNLLPDACVIPGRGQVMITKPIKGLKFKGIFHFLKGYYYFRELDGRILFGGGRNLDFETEETTDFGFNSRIQNDLLQKLKEMIIPDTPFEVDMHWTGIMAFGNTKTPIIKAVSSRVYGAYRMGGMGVALATDTASKLAKLVII